MGQSITPLNTNEFCPNVVINFTITAPGTYDLVQLGAWNGASVGTRTIDTANGNTIATVDIQFVDQNQTQFVKMQCFRGGNIINEYIYPFKKIRSLLVYESHSVPSPVLSSINALPCQIQNFSISFNKVTYVNTSETPVLTFGTIDNYEYSLPAGWSINGGTPVTGPTDYRIAGNNVIITSDDHNGITGYVGIRAVNNCSGNLVTGTPMLIPVVRAKPPLTFSASSIVCSSATFTAISVPSWVTNFNWQLTNPAFTFSSPTTNPTTITNSSSAEGEISLTISNSTCPLTFTYNTSEIIGQSKLVGGTPVVATGLQIYFSPGDENEVCRYTENYIPVTSGFNSNVNWSYVSHSGNPQPSWNGTSSDIYVYFFRTQQTSLVLQLDATNSCGTTSYQFGFKPIDCPSFFATANTSYTISPNPSIGQIFITKKSTQATEKQKTAETDFNITRISIYDLQNNLRFTQKYDKVSSALINLKNLKSGNYFVTIVSGKYTETQQIILQ